MEAEDAAQTFAGARDFLNHYVFNLMGILDQCSLEAVDLFLNGGVDAEKHLVRPGRPRPRFGRRAGLAIQS